MSKKPQVINDDKWDLDQKEEFRISKERGFKVG
jgi:hypothetical protein